MAAHCKTHGTAFSTAPLPRMVVHNFFEFIASDSKNHAALSMPHFGTFSTTPLSLVFPIFGVVESELISCSLFICMS
jgi:hypothetical protein